MVPGRLRSILSLICMARVGGVSNSKGAEDEILELLGFVPLACMTDICCLTHCTSWVLRFR